MSSVHINVGDCIELMRDMPDCSVQCCVTSPPYWGLRDYGHEGQIGLEDTPEDYVERIVAVFREVRRVLKDDGTLWLNLGDSYGCNSSMKTGLDSQQLLGMPWRVAFALQADGWRLRQDIIWHKPNPMPESVRNRCTKAHEYLFLLAKGSGYYFDSDAIREESISTWNAARGFKAKKKKKSAGDPLLRTHGWSSKHADVERTGRNRRSVWSIMKRAYRGAHFAVMPSALVEPCIKAGSREGDTILDPFAGSGTTLAVAMELGRNAVGCELNPDYAKLAEERIDSVRANMPLFTP